MRKLVTALLVLFVFFSIQTPILAAPSKPSKPSAPTLSVPVTAIYVKPKHSVSASFNNLKAAKKISYTLMYESNGVGQGVMGTITPGKQKSITRLLYLGTCSGKVCVAHKNVKNIQLEVTATLKTGKVTTKIYKIKN